VGALLTSNLLLLTSSTHQYSNRHSYEKLEVDLTHLSSTKVPFLIDTKTDFVQGENAQFQCTPPTHRAAIPEATDVVLIGSQASFASSPYYRDASIPSHTALALSGALTRRHHRPCVCLRPRTLHPYTGSCRMIHHSQCSNRLAGYPDSPANPKIILGEILNAYVNARA
jgi:hypothetical protein